MSTQKQTDKQIITSLMRSLNVIENINRGGCLFASYAVYLKSKELGLKNISIVQADYYEAWRVGNNKKFLLGETSIPVPGWHYVIQVKGKLIDSTGIRLADECTCLILKDEDIKKICVPTLRGGGWNDSFNREEGVKEIKKILGIDLSHCL